MLSKRQKHTRNYRFLVCYQKDKNIPEIIGFGMLETKRQKHTKNIKL